MTALIVPIVAFIIASIFEEEVKNVEDDKKRKSLYALERKKEQQK